MQAFHTGWRKVFQIALLSLNYRELNWLYVQSFKKIGQQITNPG